MYTTGRVLHVILAFGHELSFNSVYTGTTLSSGILQHLHF